MEPLLTKQGHVHATVLIRIKVAKKKERKKRKWKTRDRKERRRGRWGRGKGKMLLTERKLLRPALKTRKLELPAALNPPQETLH